MKIYTYYEMEDYDAQSDEIYNLPLDELAQSISIIAREWLPDYNFTGDESDFWYHRQQIIMDRVEEILEQMNQKEK